MLNAHIEYAAMMIMSTAYVRFIDRKQRWEATAQGIKQKGYGTTENEALEMLKRIVNNHVHDRPELENIEEHENFSDSVTGKQSITNLIKNNYGVITTGDNAKLENVHVSINQSINKLEQTNGDLAVRFSKFIDAVNRSENLNDSAKIEVSDCLDVIAKEAMKPEENRLLHRINN